MTKKKKKTTRISMQFHWHWLENIWIILSWITKRKYYCLRMKSLKSIEFDRFLSPDSIAFITTGHLDKVVLFVVKFNLSNAIGHIIFIFDRCCLLFVVFVIVHLNATIDYGFQEIIQSMMCFPCLFEWTKNNCKFMYKMIWCDAILNVHL